jgi:probable HAF family extracellular repeat protein
MQDLGTLGGPDAGLLDLIMATVINERGQVASCSYTNFTPNPVTHTPTLDPFLWERGVMQDLGSLGGTSGCAISLNNRGYVVGYSNLAGDLTFHPFLWNSESLKDLGTLGGDNGVPFQINDRGSIVGRADVTDICTACAPGNQKQLHHPFLWRNDVMLDLGLVSGDTAGTAYSVNSKDQVVGSTIQCVVINPDDSCSGSPVYHAFLWEEDSIVDLRTLIIQDFGITVNDVRNINERGEIAALGVLPNGDTHALLLIPCNENHPDVEGCDYSMVDASATQSNDSAPRPLVVTPQITSSPKPTGNQIRNRWMQRYRLPAQRTAPEG